jgi:integrase
VPNLKVTLKIRIHLLDGSRPYCDVVLTTNGKIKPLYAVVNGEPEHHPEGVYAIRFPEKGRPRYKTVGKDPAAALIAKRKKETFLQAKADGIAVVGESPKGTSTTGTLRPIAEAVAEYLTEVQLHKSWATHRAYRRTLDLFTESCTKNKHLEQIDRKDILDFMTHMKSKRQAPRTVANRVGYLETFLKHFGIASLLTKTDKPKYTEKVVSAYVPEEIDGLMAAATREEYEAFQFFLCTGAREQEVQFAVWRDLNFTDKTFRVTERLDLGFTPKDYEEREIPIPDSLVDLLRERRRRYPKTRLIFPSKTGKPQGHFLRILKKLALGSGLNCGNCYNKKQLCCCWHPVCDRWELHRFRKTFATMHHESGVSARTLQRWLGHSDLETTLRYLAGSDDKSKRTREQVNGTFAVLNVPPPGPTPQSTEATA